MQLFTCGNTEILRVRHVGFIVFDRLQRGVDLFASVAPFLQLVLSLSSEANKSMPQLKLR